MPNNDCWSAGAQRRPARTRDADTEEFAGQQFFGVCERRGFRFVCGLDGLEVHPGAAECLRITGLVANAVGELTVGFLSSEQARALQELPVPGSASAQELAILTRAASQILQATTFFLERADRAWKVAAETVVDRPIPPPDSFAKLLRGGARDLPVRLGTVGTSGRWTIVAMPDSGLSRATLLISGDWRLSASDLSAFAARLRWPRTASIGRSSLRRPAARLARRLAGAQGLRPVCEAIVSAMARGVGAKLGSIAVVEEGQRRLAIKATYGYALLLVEHLRFEAGNGIIGQVFESRKHLRGIGAPGTPPAQRQRPRYRTDAFLSVPIRSGQEVIAVVSVADPVGRHTFTSLDLALMKMLAAPAALALARERATARAETYAHAAAIDPVSGLFNRRYFHIRIEEELQRSRRHQIPVALIIVDLDDFKAINDSYGHLVGDAIIRETSEILRRSVRVFDVCTRFGGDEFAIIMPGSGADSATSIAERIRAHVEAYRSRDPALAELTVTVSIGLGVSGPDVSARDLISHADQALYLAKRGGKNRVQYFGSGEEPR